MAGARSRVAAGRTRPLLDAKEDANLRLQEHAQELGFSRLEWLVLRLLRAVGRVYWVLRVAARFTSSPPPWNVRRVLVVRQGWLGDLVAFLPALAALRARFPCAHLTLGVQRGFSAGRILESSGLVDEVREITFPEGGWTRVAGLARLFASGPDLVVHGAWYFTMRAAFFTGAPRMVGIDDGHPRQAELDVKVALQPLRHESENNLAVAEVLGAKLLPADRVPRLPLMNDPARAAALLARIGLVAGVPLVAMHPGSKRLSRRWPAERFAELATSLLDERTTLFVVLTGTPGEHALGESIRTLVPMPQQARVVNASGTCDLAELRLLLGACEALICNDTGVMHLARAQGTPMVALLGPENDLRWGPHPLGPAPVISLRHRVPCAPCNRHLCEPHWCLRLLSVAEAHGAVRELAKVAAPGRDSSDALASLDRRQRHHTWSDISAAGYEVPLVTVVLVDQAPAGRSGTEATEAAAQPVSSGAVENSRLAQALAAVAAQRYPRLEVLVPAWDGGMAQASPAAFESCEASLDRVVTLRVAPDAGRAWHAILHEARGEFVCLARMNQVRQWHREKLGDDVAALVRTPAAGFTSSVAPLAADASPATFACGTDACTFRRSAAVASLGEPCAPGDSMPPAFASAAGASDEPGSVQVGIESALRTLLAPYPRTVSSGFVS